jgi:predicted Zn-dependent protease
LGRPEFSSSIRRALAVTATPSAIPSTRALTRRAWLSRAGIGTAALFLNIALAESSLFAEEPHVPVRTRGSLSDEEEIALGRRFAIELEKETPLLSNPLIDQHLNSMARQLANPSQRPGRLYHVKVINSGEVNASSLPGGTIYINRGMLELLTSEDELAALLGHEIGHVVGRHAINRLMLTFQARALLQPVLDNLNKQNGIVEKIILQLGGAVALLARLHFSRQDEAQADLLGFYEVLRAGWDPRGFVKMFAAVEALEKNSEGSSIPFLSGHPSTPERLAAIQHELTQITVPEDARTDSLDFRACKAALKLLPPPPRSYQPQ